MGRLTRKREGGMRTAWATAAPPPKTTPRNAGQRSRRTGENQSRRDQMKLAPSELLGQAAAHARQHKVAVWRGRRKGGVSPRPPDQRQNTAPLGPKLLPLAAGLV